MLESRSLHFQIEVGRDDGVRAHLIIDTIQACGRELLAVSGSGVETGELDGGTKVPLQVAVDTKQGQLVATLVQRRDDVQIRNPMDAGNARQSVLYVVLADIANFGGDPRNVTIFGESAGSLDINVLLTSPLTKGLFTRLIGESGPVVSTAFAG